MVAVYVIWPILSTLWLSLCNRDGMTERTFVSLANYVELQHAPTFYIALRNNVIWLVLFMLAPPLGLALALYLNQAVAGIRLVKPLFLAPFVRSGVIVGLIFPWFHDPAFGLLARIAGHGIPVLGDARHATFGIVFAALWPQTPCCTILYLTGLTAVNPGQIGAARIDGAGVWTVFRRIVLPLIRPALAALAILVFTFVWNDYFRALCLTQGDEAAPIIVGVAAQKGQWTTSWHLVSAGSILAAGLTFGATKG
ncbi:ABC transporter permease subunit [Burkholderia anthina]|uniref:ABC transporter permease subunit n=1 Tax=Burkholderia anthina TaxID=179879 RepID=UPI00385041A9